MARNKSPRKRKPSKSGGTPSVTGIPHPRYPKRFLVSAPPQSVFGAPAEFFYDTPVVRYYGFLSNRKRGTLLPKVYEALKMEARKKPEKSGFAVLMKGFVGTDPYKCILCGDRLRFAGAQAGLHATKLLSERLHGMERKRWLLMPEWEQCA